MLDCSQYNQMRLACAQPKYNTVLQDRARMRVKHRIGPFGLGKSPLLLKLKRPKVKIIHLMNPQRPKIDICLIWALIVTW